MTNQGARECATIKENSMTKLDILKALLGAVLITPVFYAFMVIMLAMQP